MRILFFGMASRFSATILAALQNSVHTICGVVLPAPPNAPPVTIEPAPRHQHSTIPLADSYTPSAAFAHAAGVPVLAIGDLRAPETIAALAALAPDIACIACFPRRIPATVRALPPAGSFNVHPSLLPYYRGPEPIFWNMRDGTPTGVTIHQIDAGLDTGPIAAQEPLTLPDGIGSTAIDEHYAAYGAALLIRVLNDAAAGRLVLRQQPSVGSYQSTPRATDFTFDHTWSARRAFNFMRATAAWGVPYTVRIGESDLCLTTAIGYDAQILQDPVAHTPTGIALRMADGTLYATKG